MLPEVVKPKMKFFSEAANFAKNSRGKVVSVAWDELLQFLEPVEDDVDLLNPG